MKALLAGISLFFALTSSLFAQEVHDAPLGFFVESGSKSVVCSAHKEFGHPVYFIVRTNDPQAFFDTLEAAKKCLTDVHFQMSNYKKYAKEMIPLTMQQQSVAPLNGEYNSLICKEWRNKKGMSMMYEFVFPYREKEELLAFMHETPLRACLSTVEAVPVSWKEQS